MKTILLIIAGLFLIQSGETFSKNYFVRGETKTGTFYLYSQSLHDSLGYLKLFDSKENEINAIIEKSITHFSPQEQPNLKLIKLDYTFNIPLDFDLTDSLFHFGFKTRLQHDTTYDYPFYILTNKPVSDLKLLSPIDSENDVSILPNFKWTVESHPAIRSYRFQLSENSSFTNNIIDSLLIDNKFQISNELETMTKYFWRVKSEFEDNEIGYIQSTFTTGARTTWTPITIEKFHYARDIQQIESNRLIIVDQQIGFQVSDNNGISWTNIKTPNIIAFGISDVIDATIYATAFDVSDNRYKILKSSNNGSNWSVDFLMPEGNPYQTEKKMRFAINQKNNFTIAFLNKILKYDNIKTKNLIYESIPDTSFITGFVELDNSNIVTISQSRYVANETDKGEICIISNNGTEIRKVFSNYNGENVDFLSINRLENGFLVASGFIESNKSSIFLISEDSGETWNLSGIVENSELRSTISTFDGYLISNFYNNPRLIMLSKDYGNTWINISGNLPSNYTANDIKILGDSILYYLGNSNILYKTNIQTDIDLTIYPVGKVETDSDIITFNWKRNRRAEKYNIQIALNEDFENIGSIKEEGFFVDEEINGNSYQFENFELNTVYYWRIRPFYAGKWMNWYKSESFEIDNVSDVKENDNSQNFVLYPNPTNDFIHINFENMKITNSVDNKIHIFDVLGNEILQIEIQQSQSKKLIDVSNLQSGIYYVKIGSIKAKFVKK